MNVLLVDDSSLTRKMLGSILESWGCDVTEADTGEDGWRVMQTDDPPRMVLLDFVLPGMSGSELCERIRGRPGKQYFYVIMLSVKADRETKMECLEAGADDFVVKSCDPEELEQRFRAGQRILQLHDRLHSMIRQRDDFLAMISHELRNPVGAVLNAIGAIGSVDTQFQEEHNVMHRQMTHMSRLLDDLLDVARIQHNKVELRKETVDLIALSEEVLEAIQHQYDANDQILHVTARDGPLLVFGDPARLKQAQINLLTNASKYTTHGGDVWFDIASGPDQAVITIRDAGDGIPDQLLDDIFDPFVQSDTTLEHSSGGMGVGLSLAKGIVEAHGGSIVAESEGPGTGSTFRICLPLTDKRILAKVPAPHLSFQGCRLLLVEDNEDARTMLAKTLRLRGFDVTDAGDGLATLELVRSFSPQIIVIDIGLPGMDGYQLAREIRNMPAAAQTMLVALTGYGRQEDRQAAIEAGFDAHLVKPLNPPELYRQISARFVTT